jgi:putative ABC transport system ATP-binding protein
MEPRDANEIRLHRVTKRYGERPVLDQADLSVRRGEFLAIIGRSGSGKSTLLRLIGALESPDEGAVEVAGHDVVTLDETQRATLRRRALGFVFQFFNLIPTLTVAENVELPLALNGVPKSEARRRAVGLLDELGLEHCADRFPEELSGGEQQRVAVARAVIHEPRIVLADEPTGNLDNDTAARVLALLTSLCSQRGTTLLMATHSTEAAERADRVLTIRNGRLAAA